MTKPFDALLREALKEGAGGQPAAPCLDADTAAAWVDGDLSAGDRANAEAHVAGCARCQQLLAAMVRTSQADPARAAWLAPAARWLVPLAAAAASLLVWVNLSERATETPAVPELRSADRTASVAPGRAGTEKAEAVGGQAQGTEKGEGRREKGEGRSENAAVKADTLAADTRQARETLTTAVRAAEAPAGAPAPPTALADASVAPPAAAPPPAAPPPAAPPVGVSAEAAAVTGAVESMRFRRTAPTPPPELLVRAPGGKTQWRASGPGVVHRSVDDGMTWETQMTGVAEMMTAGAAASPAVCWLVGPGGVVLISVDGRTWQRLPFPDSQDLVAVIAADDKKATVTARDGRTFSTTDGGRTWRP